MLKLTSADVPALIRGTTFFGTGGGGPPAEARRIYRRLFVRRPFLPIIDVAELPPRSRCLTAFGVGAIEPAASPEKLIVKSYQALKPCLKTKVAGIIPVEIGPASVAATFYLASTLQLPVIDADCVGGRSSPEVFLETLTLFRQPRTPLAVTNSRLETELITTALSPTALEKRLRSVAARAGGTAMVVGYPLSPRDLRRSVETGTLTEALNLGRRLPWRSGKPLGRIKLLFRGQVTKIKNISTPGFTTKKISLRSPIDRAELFIKNENLVFWLNQRVAVTCPDLIMLLNSRGYPIYNDDLALGQPVQALAAPARPRWRSPAGLRLFTPRLFGFDFGPKLLAD